MLFLSTESSAQALQGDYSCRLPLAAAAAATVAAAGGGAAASVISYFFPCVADGGGLRLYVCVFTTQSTLQRTL